MNGNKYEVWATVWNSELGQPIKKVVGEFDKFMNAHIFAEAYREYYSASAEIIEYIRK